MKKFSSPKITISRSNAGSRKTLVARGSNGQQSKTVKAPYKAK